MSCNAGWLVLRPSALGQKSVHRSGNCARKVRGCRNHHFTDFWTRAALTWKDHPEFGDHGRMSEPDDLPCDGGIVARNDEPQVLADEDLMIWPEFTKVAIATIRALDASGVIYLNGSKYGGALNHASRNPAWLRTTIWSNKCTTPWPPTTTGGALTSTGR